MRREAYALDPRFATVSGSYNYFGFGTDNDLEASPNHLIIKHATFPSLPLREGLGPAFGLRSGAHRAHHDPVE